MRDVGNFILVGGFLIDQVTLCRAVNKNAFAIEAFIATGGSVVYGGEAMKHLGEISVIVYLRLSYKAVKSRLHDVKGRGVVLRDGQTLHDLYVEREGLYEKYADVTIEEDGLNVEETLEKTLQALEMLVK